MANMNKSTLGDFEEIVLLAVARLRDDAYGVTILETLESVAGRKASIGAIYATLERLERKGFVSSLLADPTPERGGRVKRYYRVEGAGIRALRETQGMRMRLWEG